MDAGTHKVTAPACCSCQETASMCCSHQTAAHTRCSRAGCAQPLLSAYLWVPRPPQLRRQLLVSASIARCLCAAGAGMSSCFCIKAMVSE